MQWNEAQIRPLHFSAVLPKNRRDVFLMENLRKMKKEGMDETMEEKMRFKKVTSKREI